MDEDQIKAAARQVRSTIKQAVRKLTGETGTRAERAAENATGKAESTANDAKDAVRTRPRK